MSQDISVIPNEENPEIAPIAAQRLPLAPSRSLRNKFFTELGSLKMPEGNVRAYADRRNGSLLFVMPDSSGFIIDTNLAGTQCYKYWLRTSIAPAVTPEAVNSVDESAKQP